ncbi:diguanylate cyclase [Alkalidesulfovibrio alkalitolerans DSM 16529]|uniref:diguanylate cyclase n=1 Tax=Alkalidesulfovibrio alkalitolerans DSM 16529 TaxID=1121439 RepID=S7UKD0_9BACT|nr:sensor domain-containing diguanylate cyclase [Alkalidesulfovibrio alkalitolerans]EPR34279.1 diguanylate cyclase [Alkalidesulfovibrio alkalitolerans DSM 16529]
MNAKTKLLLAISAILVTAFVGVSALNYTLTRSALHEELLTKDLPLTRDNIHSGLVNQLSRPLMVASSMSADAFLKEWATNGERDVSRITDYLRGIQERYGYLSTFFVSAQTLRYYHFKGLHKVLSPASNHDMWYFGFVRSGREYRLDVDTDEASEGTLTIFLNFRVEDASGRLLGVTGVGLRLEHIADLIRSFQERYERTVYLVDWDGRVQVHSDLSLIERSSIRTMPGVEHLAESILATRGEPQSFEFTRDGRDILLTVRHIEDLDWYVIVEQDETAALSHARMNFLRTVGSGLIASLAVILLTLATINRYQRSLERLAVTDELTGAANRRRLDEAFKRAAYVHRRHGRDFSLVVMDIDDFKRVNDEMGHLAGDRVLKELARLLFTVVRPTDLVVRWGGDEFIVLAETDGGAAFSMAERISRLVRESGLAGPDAAADDPRRGLTICCGVAQYQSGETLDATLRRADAAMYACKSEGGDGVRAAACPTP